MARLSGTNTVESVSSDIKLFSLKLVQIFSDYIVWKAKETYFWNPAEYIFHSIKMHFKVYKDVQQNVPRHTFHLVELETKFQSDSQDTYIDLKQYKTQQWLKDR